MSGFEKEEKVDHMADNPWATASGLPNWQDDYTRFRTGGPLYASVDDLQGRVKTGRELDAPKL